MPRLSALRRSSLLAVALSCTAAQGAHAAPVTAPVQPLAVVGEADRPSCSNPLAPFILPDLLGWHGQLGGLGDYLGRARLQAELEATIRGVDLAPAVVLCSSGFSGLPGPVTGETAAPMSRSRVGLGWRELGGTLRSPAPLVPGDRLSLPALDDTAEVRLSLAAKAGEPAVVGKLVDLSPGPLGVTVLASGGQVVATLTRGDGSSTSISVTPPTVPAPDFRARLQGRSLQVRSRHLPGTTVAHLAAQTNEYGDAEPGGTTARAGLSRTASARLRLRSPVRPNRTIRLNIYAANRVAQVVQAWECRITVDARRRLGRPRCKRYGLADLVRESLKEYRPNGGELGFSPDDGLIDVVTAARASRPKGPERARAMWAPQASRTSAVADGLALVPTPLTSATAALAPRSVRVLPADVNGDGAPDYWTDVTGGETAPAPDRGRAIGYVLVSGPAGLSAHRVIAPSLPAAFDPEDSEISAVGDLTGDGIGELTVDVVERIVLIPGSKDWTSTTTPLLAPDPAALAPADVLIAPQLSAPGAPLSTMPDATGDGLRELTVVDDEGAIVSVASESLLRGAPTRVPSAARAVVEPLAIEQTILFERGAPQVYPAGAATQIIGGHAVSVRWQRASRLKAPAGRATLTVRDALGRALRPAVTLTTPGDVHVLDYDPPTGELLLRAITAGCDTDRYGPRPGCRDSLLRVRADGSVRQQLSLRYAQTEAAAPLATSRFLPDGRDPDTDPEVVLSAPPRDVALLGSSASGLQRLADLPRLRLPRRAWTDTGGQDPITFRALIGPGGERRVVTLLPTTPTDLPGGQAPAELVWR